MGMFLSINKLPNNISQGDKPNPKAAQALQEGLGGQFGEMRTIMQYLFQNMNFRGDATPYKDLLRSIATEEMGHVELVANTINVLLEGASTPSENPVLDWLMLLEILGLLLTFTMVVV